MPNIIVKLKFGAPFPGNVCKRWGKDFNVKFYRVTIKLAPQKWIWNALKVEIDFMQDSVQMQSKPGFHITSITDQKSILPQRNRWLWSEASSEIKLDWGMIYWFYFTGIFLITSKTSVSFRSWCDIILHNIICYMIYGSIMTCDVVSFDLTWYEIWYHMFGRANDLMQFDVILYDFI